jgi:hypothetical protein
MNHPATPLVVAFPSQVKKPLNAELAITCRTAAFPERLMRAAR